MCKHIYLYQTGSRSTGANAFCGTHRLLARNAARKQQRINTIASASNSAVALTEAIKGILAAGATTAAEGGGVIGYVAGIIAAFAAVAGLYASVKSLEPVGAYKDGVIDFKGKGTGTSDSNLVRISKGESVITAKATQQYRPILEAMNSHKPLPIHHTEMPYKYRHQNNNNKQSHEITIADVDVKTLVTNERLATLVKVHERKEKARWK